MQSVQSVEANVGLHVALCLHSLSPPRLRSTRLLRQHTCSFAGAAAYAWKGVPAIACLYTQQSLPWRPGQVWSTSGFNRPMVAAEHPTWTAHVAACMMTWAMLATLGSFRVRVARSRPVRVLISSRRGMQVDFFSRLSRKLSKRPRQSLRLRTQPLQRSMVLQRATAPQAATPDRSTQHEVSFADRLRSFTGRTPRSSEPGTPPASTPPPGMLNQGSDDWDAVRLALTTEHPVKKSGSKVGKWFRKASQKVKDALQQLNNSESDNEVPSCSVTITQEEYERELWLPRGSHIIRPPANPGQAHSQPHTPPQAAFCSPQPFYTPQQHGKLHTTSPSTGVAPGYQPAPLESALSLSAPTVVEHTASSYSPPPSSTRPPAYPTPLHSTAPTRLPGGSQHDTRAFAFPQRNVSITQTQREPQGTSSSGRREWTAPHINRRPDNWAAEAAHQCPGVGWDGPHAVRHQQRSSGTAARSPFQYSVDDHRADSTDQDRPHRQGLGAQAGNQLPGGISGLGYDPEPQHQQLFRPQPHWGTRQQPAHTKHQVHDSQDDDLNVTAIYTDRKLQSIQQPWSSVTVDYDWELGKGGFGMVYAGVWQHTTPVAIKMLSPDKVTPRVLHALRQEAILMCDITNPYIARVYGLVDDGQHHALIMRHYQRGSLSAAIRYLHYQCLPLIARLTIAQQVACGMCSLHGRKPNPIIHGDLKTSNLLIENDGNSVVIADFGLAACLRHDASGHVVENGALTLTISPPEVLGNPTAPRTTAGDVYAFGITLLEIVTGKPAYSGISREQLESMVLSGGRPAIPVSVPPEVASIIRDCWAQQPQNRPSFAELQDKLRLLIDELKQAGYPTRPRLSELSQDLADSDL